MDEEELPQEFTPQVLVDDNFGRDVEVTTAEDSVEVGPTDSSKSLLPQTVTSSVQTAPLDGLLPCSSGSMPVVIVSKKEKVEYSVTPSKRADANKRSPFTRFISTVNLDKDKTQNR